MSYAIIHRPGADNLEVDDEEELKHKLDQAEHLGIDVERVERLDEAEAGSVDMNGNTGDATVVEHQPDDEPQSGEKQLGLAGDPIGYLRSINPEYVNTIKGTDAISKKGLRYIQYEHGISTTSEFVAFTDDPYGVIFWARAELPDGTHAEAHGEGYPTESGLQTEWVRYADTRAKSRAILELTSAGALAVDELKGGVDG